MNLSEICTLTHIWQEFPLAKAIFVGIGVLLSVRILDIYARPIYQRLHLAGS